MAGLWDRFLGFLGFEEEEEPEELVEVPLAAQAGGSRPLRVPDDAPLPPRRAMRMAALGDAEAGPAAPRASARAESRLAPSAGRGSNVTRLHPGLPGLVVAQPKRFEDAQEAADHLRSGKPVILHAEGLDRDVVQRLVHFLMGATYALGGEMHRVGSVVLFAPAGVDVTVPITLRLAEGEGR